MKFHAYRNLLAAVAGAALLLGSFGASAKSGPGEERLELQNQARMQYGDNFRSASVKAIFGANVVRDHGVCGDSSPDAGEECDDGNTAAGDGCSATCTLEAGFDCTVAVHGVDTDNTLPGGSFEAGATEWTIVHNLFSPACEPFCLGGQSGASDGTGWIWIAGGSFASATDGTVTQSVTISASASSLTFDWGVLFSGATCDSASDFMEVTLDGNVVFTTPSLCAADGGPFTVPAGYVSESIDLATATGGPYNDGAAHTLVFHGVANAVDPTDITNIFLDNARINVPLVPPIPPVPSACTAIVCGDSILGSTEACDDGNTAAGDGCSATCEVEQPDFVCDDPLAPAASGEDVADGGLEDGAPNPNWVETGTQFAPICSQVFCGAALANDGAFFGWFGGSSLPNAQTLTQDVTISATATDLTFDLLVGICDSADDSLTVEIDGTEIYRYDCTADTPAYQAQTAALGAFADGGVHQLQFIGNTVATNAGNSNFFVDNISIEDNVAFGGAPGSCFELNPACDTIEQFSAGIPAGWTVVNLGVDAADGFGASNDGICASQNWSGGNADNNVTGGDGIAACADSDATGQIDIDGGGTANEMDAYLCSPMLDLTMVTDPTFSFLVNYQAADNDLNDNGTPGDTSDDFDDDFLEVLVGTSAPNALTVPNYTSLGNVFDHLDSTLALSEEAALAADLTAQNGEAEAYVCFHYRGTYAWFAQVDNAGVRGSACVAPVDTDLDGVPDSIDNCLTRANADQRDTDGDGHGNQCDADLNQDCIVNPLDLGLFKLVFFTPDPDADFNGDGIVNPLDLGIFKLLFFTVPGPSPVGSLCNP